MTKKLPRNFFNLSDYDYSSLSKIIPPLPAMESEREGW